MSSQNRWRLVARSGMVWLSGVRLVATSVFVYFLLFRGLSGVALSVMSGILLTWTLLELVLYWRAKRLRQER